MYFIGKVLKRITVLCVIIVIVYFAFRMYFMINYPLSYQTLIKKYSEKYDVDPYLVAAIINVESKFDKNAVSNKNARGLMQIAPITGKWASEELNIDDFDVEDLFDPELNIMIGSWYLNVLSQEFDNNLQLILAAYNAGSGNVVRWLQNKMYSEDGKSLMIIPFNETKDFVNKVQKNISIYKILYEDEFAYEISNKENYLVLFMNNLRKVIKSFVIYK